MKILVADDDSMARFVLRSVLPTWDYEVCEATTGDEAWEQLAGPDPARLAIVDWIMPGLQGPELCRKVKALSPKAPPYIIMLTSKIEPHDVVQGLDSGADDFMAKPYHLEELRARLNVGRQILNLQAAVMQANEQLEHRVRERTEEVQRLLRSREEMLEHLGHDLKTPLTPLMSMLPMLQASETDPRRRQMLDLALESARHIHQLSTGVLELLRVSGLTPANNPTGEDLRRLVEAACAQCSNAGLWDGRAYTLDMAAGLRVFADPLELQRAIVCLLENAAKFTESQGQIHIRATANDDMVTVIISDDGVGLRREQLVRVFEPFYKGDVSRHDRSAPGLGLAIVKTIVERHGGRAWAESRGPNRGTSFCFTLPRAKGAS